MSEEILKDMFEREELHFAVQQNDLDRVKELVLAGSGVNLFDDIGCTPLHYACRSEFFPIADFLVEHGADVNAHDEPSIGNTPLGDIAGSCSVAMAEWLLEHKADPSIRGWMQLNALDRAERRKREEGRKVYSLLQKAAKT
jgi:ankyrin repeat protein